MTDEPIFVTLEGRNGDIAINDGQSENATGLQVLTNAEAFANRLKMSLTMQKGSCLYDTDAGFDWHRLVTSDNPVLVETLIRDHCQRMPFVQSVDSITTDVNETNRVLKGTVYVTTTLGEAVQVVFNNGVQ